MLAAAPAAPPRRPPSKEALKHMRVVQRNLVYVIGLAPSVARDSLLERREYFGQYGRIVKLVVNKQVGSGTAIVGVWPVLVRRSVE